MAKDPAFLFYPGDYIAGTMHLDFLCKGAYIDLLMLQFNRGHMTLDMIKHMLGQDFGQVWGQIEDKFKVEIEKDIKYFFNERLRLEKKKRCKYVESRSNNKKGNNQHNKKPIIIDDHMTSHMEDENKNEDKDINGSEIKINNRESFELIKRKLKERETWHDKVEMTLKLRKGSAKSLLDEFFNELESQEDFYQKEQDYIKYFFFWARKQKPESQTISLAQKHLEK